MYNSIDAITGNCLLICLYTRWSSQDLVDLVNAATGWDVSPMELFKVGQRGLTLARLFNAREGFTPNDDRLAERSYGPTTNGALANGGIDREALREALDTFYGMMGWDTRTGVPTAATLHELGVSWAVEHLPK